MKTSDAIDQIATALAAAQAEMKNATLNKVNPHFKSKYADLAGVRDAVVPTLSKHGISVVQGTEVGDKGLTVITRLLHKTGQWIESEFPIALDKPQAMGSAYTYARRYSLSAMCCIAADEDDDANEAQKGDKPPPPQLLTREEARKLYKALEAELVQQAELREVAAWEKDRELAISKLGDWKSYIDKAIEKHKEFILNGIAQQAAE